MKLAAVIAMALALMAGAAEARPAPQEFDRHAIYSIGSEAVLTERAVRKVRTAKHAKRKHQRKHRIAPANNATAQVQHAGSTEAKLLPHPVGCPRRSFCGCGVSVYLFGKAVVQGGLAIAAEWLRFPRAQPGPGMVAARRGHVFAILQNLGNGKVLAYDPNSGGHKTRIHVRSLAGYTVVNPRAAYAEAG